MAGRHPRKFRWILASLALAGLVGWLAFQLFRPSVVNPLSLELAPEEKAWLAAHSGKIRLAPAPEYPPKDFFDGSGRYCGITAEYIHRIEEMFGFRFQIVQTASWDEMVRRARNGEFDAVTSIVNTPERRAFLNFTFPYHVSANIIVVRKDRPGSLTLGDMTGWRTAIVQGYILENWIHRDYPAVTIVPVDAEMTALEKVSAGEVDATVMELDTATYLIQEKGFTNLRFAGQTDYPFLLCLATRRGLPILQSILDKGMNRISLAEREEIRDRWFNLRFVPIYRDRRIWLAGLAGLGTLALILAGVFAWNRILRRKVVEQTAELKNYQDNLEQMVATRTAELEKALGEVKTLKGFIPICCHCKKVRNDAGYWAQIETYIQEHSEAEFTHGFCPECARKLYPEMNLTNL